MAAEARADAPLAPPSGCASPLRPMGDNNALLQRPFTASGARTTRLLSVLVHWGEHLDWLTSDTHGVLDGEDHGSTHLNTYVALRTSCRSDDPHLPRAAERDDDDALLAHYELLSSPFATSRVIERSAHPMWNELLLVPLPVEWRQQKDAAAWVLHVDVVRRDPSQQEDALLATVVLPLQSLGIHRVPQHVAINLAAPTSHPSPRLHLSLSDTDDLEHSQEVLEVLLQEMENESQLEQKPDAQQTKPAAMMILTTSPMDSPHSVRELFMAIGTDSLTRSPPPNHYVWITPIARPKPIDGTTRQCVQWQFPTMFSRPSADTISQLYGYVYSVVLNGDSFNFQCIATTAVAVDTVPTDGNATRLKVTLTPPNETSQIHGSATLYVIVRRWNSPSWERFQRSSVSRRVITTNRRHRRRMALQALEWTGALCRGLNRYPISSFCDEGGLSGLLASYLATSSQHDGANGNTFGGSGAVTVDTTGSTRQAEDLLNHHISLLQQEVMAKQEAMAKLQREGDTSATALRKCGVELVAARKDVHAREEQIFYLQAKLQDMEQRDAKLTRELLEGTGGMNGLRIDSDGAQRLNKLIFKYKELEERHTKTEAELTDAKRTSTAFERLEKKYAELEQAHVVQAGLVQRLQKDKSQHSELQRTIRMQEKVIRKLEKAVALHQPSDPKENSTVTTQLPIAPQQLTAPETNSPLLAMRVHVLQQQLETNAKAAANEIGRLKMRVLELETQLSMGMDGANSMSPTQRPDR